MGLSELSLRYLILYSFSIKSPLSEHHICFPAIAVKVLTEQAFKAVLLPVVFQRSAAYIAATHLWLIPCLVTLMLPHFVKRISNILSVHLTCVLLTALNGAGTLP